MTDDGRSWWWDPLGGDSGDLTSRDRRNQQWCVIWIFLWAVSFAASAILIREGVITATVAGVIAILVTTALGLGVISSYWRFLSQADELQRKIQLEALGVGFGSGFIGAVTLHLVSELYGFELELIDLLPVMGIPFAAALLVARRRYR